MMFEIRPVNCIQEHPYQFLESDLFFQSREDAERVLKGMRFFLSTYGFVSVADLFDLSGKTYQYSETIFTTGWDDLCTAYVYDVLDGSMLKLPSITTKRRGNNMSERQEKKRRYNARLEYISHFEKWLESEPPMIRIFAWRKWKKNRPTYKEEPEYAEA